MKARSGLLIGVTAGAAAVAMRPAFASLFTGVARPLAKVLLTRGHLAAERLRTGVARGAESLDDLMAEARADVQLELARRRAVNGSAHVSGAGAAVSASGEQTSRPAAQDSSKTNVQG
jgi:hypothetical protein